MMNDTSTKLDRILCDYCAADAKRCFGGTDLKSRRYTCDAHQNEGRSRENILMSGRSSLRNHHTVEDMDHLFLRQNGLTDLTSADE